MRLKFVEHKCHWREHEYYGVSRRDLVGRWTPHSLLFEETLLDLDNSASACDI
jgi:hypothetical protein